MWFWFQIFQREREIYLCGDYHNTSHPLSWVVFIYIVTKDFSATTIRPLDIYYTYLTTLPPAVVAGGSWTHRLDWKLVKNYIGKPLVMIFVNWCEVSTCRTWTSPSMTLSRMKWISIMMCLVRRWWTWLVVVYTTLTLSRRQLWRRVAVDGDPREAGATYNTRRRHSTLPQLWSER
jgi:hypothetical protein